MYLITSKTVNCDDANESLNLIHLWTTSQMLPNAADSQKLITKCIKIIGIFTILLNCILPAKSLWIYHDNWTYCSEYQHLCSSSLAFCVSPSVFDEAREELLATYVWQGNRSASLLLPWQPRSGSTHSYFWLTLSTPCDSDTISEMFDLLFYDKEPFHDSY